ncbi:DUF4276 family protein [Emticicia sp. TH156]|uniref:DUF4276 family protein n=1 Tax=Emticicia sp. TH156 TaxID=2067454 RepID=UPI000C769301|nr:DUF4276 family protein [Emticicia sp. TH156]PLK44451.1 hypothetical protein C0V77_11750 [Emticicia sp. TH156]
MPQVFTGLFTEGSTDISFLEGIVQKALQSIAFECSGQIDIYVSSISINRSELSFVEQVIEASKKGVADFGIQIICVHTDADAQTSSNAYQNKINVAQESLSTLNPDDYCLVMAAIVPIQETEAWMLADKELLKRVIGTTKSDEELEINRNPEQIARPKEVIENAIRIARVDLTRRRRGELTISDLYSPLGQSIDIEKLRQLESFRDFENNVRQAFRSLNLLH